MNNTKFDLSANVNFVAALFNKVSVTTNSVFDYTKKNTSRQNLNISNARSAYLIEVY